MTECIEIEMSLLPGSRVRLLFSQLGHLILPAEASFFYLRSVLDTLDTHEMGIGEDSHQRTIPKNI